MDTVTAARPWHAGDNMLREWFRINREWQARPPVDLRGSVSPAVVEAASGHTFVVTLQLGHELTIPTGAHVTLEIQATWDAYLGNTYRRGVHTVGNRRQIRPGYGAYVDAESTNPDVRLEVVAHWGIIQDLVDVRIVEGELHPGDELRIILGPDDGNLVQCQKHAQVAILPVGVDLAGDGTYRRAAVHPSVRVVGAQADRLRVFAPGVVRRGEPFPIRVLPVDIYSFNPATDYRGELQVEASAGIDVPASLAADTDQGPMPATTVATAASPGVHWITVRDAAAGIIGKSGPIGVDFLRDRGIFFGELHSQMWHSMGTGTTAEFFEWGRDVAGLDFCAPANHYNWRFEVTDEVWRELVETCNAFNAPGRFATLVSYEWQTGGLPGGHKNVYFRGNEGEFLYWYRGERNTPDALWESLKGRDVLTVPHHPKAMRGADWSFRNDAHQRLVEICSNWGLSETGGPLSVQSALAMGHRLGFVGGTDSHYGLANQGSYHVNDGNGLACVVAPELTRDAIWQALYDRCCYATTGDRILLDCTMNGHPMGTDVAVDLAGAGLRTFAMRIAGTATITLIELLRNNQVVFTARPGSDTWDGEWTDTEPLGPQALQPAFENDRPFVFYYLRVTQRNRQQAWASPFWLTQTPAD
jgi:hypothetical protein